MQLASEAQIPDGVLAARVLLNEKSRLGFRAAESTVHQGLEAAKYLNRVGVATTVVRYSWQMSLKAQQQTYDSSKTGPEDPTKPGSPLFKNSIVKKASDNAFIQTQNGQAGSGLAEAGFSIEYKDGKLYIDHKTTSVNGDGTLNQLHITIDDNTIAILHTHGNRGVATPSLSDKSRGTPGDVASPVPNFVRSASHLYVTIPGTTRFTDLGNP